MKYPTPSSPMRGAERPLVGDTPYDFRERMLERMREDDLMVTDAREEDYYDLRANDGEDDDAWINPQRSSRYDSD